VDGSRVNVISRAFLPGCSSTSVVASIDFTTPVVEWLDFAVVVEVVFAAGFVAGFVAACEANPAAGTTVSAPNRTAAVTYRIVLLLFERAPIGPDTSYYTLAR
jgi:hypothetical protein